MAKVSSKRARQALIPASFVVEQRPLLPETAWKWNQVESLSLSQYLSHKIPGKLQESVAFPCNAFEPDLNSDHVDYIRS